MKKTVLFTAIFLCAILIGLFLVRGNQSHRDQSASTSDSATAPLPASVPTQPPTGSAVRASVPDTFKDTSILKPPAGAKVAIFEFEDLECPACANAYPIVHATAARYKIPLVRHDYPWSFHVWSFDAAVTARYLQDSVSPAVAEDFRRDVFASQALIAGPDDLQQFTRRWFQSHGYQLPFVVDPSGRCAAEVEADCTLGARIGVLHTPTIVVVTAKGWIEVTDPTELYAAIDRAEADLGRSAQSVRNRAKSHS